LFLTVVLSLNIKTGKVFVVEGTDEDRKDLERKGGPSVQVRMRRVETNH
jgi:hypothetical protein